MANFDLNNYETVKSRKKRFYETHQDGRIIVDCISQNQIMEYALFKVFLYKTLEDQKNNLPLASGFAMEIRDTEMSVNKYGKEYATVNYSSWVENCEESAVGRALDNAGFCGTLNCSKEEIEKAQRMEKTISTSNAKASTPQTSNSPQKTVQAPSQSGGSKPAKYVIPFGKYRNIALDDIAKGLISDVCMEDVYKYVDYIEAKAKKEGSPITGSVAQFIEEVSKYA